MRVKANQRSNTVSTHYLLPQIHLNIISEYFQWSIFRLPFSSRLMFWTSAAKPNWIFNWFKLEFALQTLPKPTIEMSHTAMIYQFKTNNNRVLTYLHVVYWWYLVDLITIICSSIFLPPRWYYWTSDVEIAMHKGRLGEHKYKHKHKYNNKVCSQKMFDWI